MSEPTDWDERVDVFWGLIGPCGHLGLAARDRAACEAYMLFSPVEWTVEHPTRRQLKEAHDEVSCEQCDGPLTIMVSAERDAVGYRR